MIAKTGRAGLIALVVLILFGAPAQAQFTVLDQAQDRLGSDAATAQGRLEACGDTPINIASMGWPSAQLLAAIHMRLLSDHFGCTVRVVPGDLASTASSMASKGQPAVAPEMWPTRVVAVWNGGIDGQMLRPAAPTYLENELEGWFIASQLAQTIPELRSAAALSTVLPTLDLNEPVRFISCPTDWACAVINRNLIAAHGMTGLVELVEPDNRFEMDALIAEAVSLREPVIFYYWQPNAVLAQLDLVALDMGDYDEQAAECLAQLDCVNPQPSAFPPEPVLVALSEWVFTDIPAIAAYFQRSSLPLAEMNALLAQLNLTGASIESVADRFVAERGVIWRSWVSPG